MLYYQRVVLLIGEEYGPRVTGMLLDLPNDKAAKLIVDDDYFK
jgi:hypothetical protein